MTDIAESAKDNDKREVFVMQISFYRPEAGPVYVLAKNKEHAKELLPKLMPSCKDIVVHDIAAQDELAKSVQDILPDSTQTPQDSGPATPATPAMVH